MTYTPGHVANFMLEKAEEEDRGLSPMKLLKLVYIGYGWVAALLDHELFDEPIYAWDHGPVVRSLYHEFKHCRNRPILDLSMDLDLDSGEYVIPHIPNEDEATNIVLDKVWDIYKHFSAWDLRQKTHEEGAPWRSVYRQGQKNIVIPKETIKAHFEKKIREYLDDARSGRAA